MSSVLGTGALDQSTGHEVMQLLTTVVRQSGASMVMVPPDPKVADWMDRLDGMLPSAMVTWVAISFLATFTP